MDTIKLHQAVVMVTLLACQVAHAEHSGGWCDGYILTGNTSLKVAQPVAEHKNTKAEGLKCDSANLDTVSSKSCPNSCNVKIYV